MPLLSTSRQTYIWSGCIHREAGQDKNDPTYFVPTVAYPASAHPEETKMAR